MRVFSPVGESLCLWATLPCVSLHLASLAVWRRLSLFPRLSSVHQPIFCPRHHHTQCLWLFSSQFLCDTCTEIYIYLCVCVSFCLVFSEHSKLQESVCLCVGRAQTSCGQGWISSPARLLLEIHPGFSSQSKSGRPRLSQHRTGLSMSTHSSSSSAAHTHTHKRVLGSDFILKKDQYIFCSCPQCNLWRRCIVCLQITQGLVII